MKAFLLSALALLVLCVGVLINSLYISSIHKEMENVMLEIKDSPSIEALEELEDIWDKSKLLISMSVPHRGTDEFERELLVLRAKIENSEHGISESIELVSRAIEEFKTHGAVSIDNVL